MTTTPTPSARPMTGPPCDNCGDPGDAWGCSPDDYTVTEEWGCLARPGTTIVLCGHCRFSFGPEGCGYRPSFWIGLAETGRIEFGRGLEILGDADDYETAAALLDETMDAFVEPTPREILYGS